MLTEREVARSWGRLLKGGNCDHETLAKAELLLEQLRPENPLRHRLTGELNELRKLYLQQQD